MGALLAGFIVAAILGEVSAVAVNQCNLGNKLYSIENGGTVCAPLAPYQCITSCQWNTSCSHTAHSLAFQGRRTFVAGMILTPENFLLLCCATFANVVQQNQRLENRCVWVPPIQTIENGPSIRFDPPLSQNEYVRDMAIQRMDRGKVEVRVQICKFMTQRTNCDENTMPPDDQQLFNLLQLRLSRTEMFLKDHNGTTNPKDFFHVPGGLEEIPTPTQDSFRDEVVGGELDEARVGPPITHRLSSQLQNRRNDIPQVREAPLVARNIVRQPNALRTPRANANSLRTSTDRFRRHEFEEESEAETRVPKARLPVVFPISTNDRVDLGQSTVLNGGSGVQPTSVISRQGSRPSYRNLAPSATVPFVPQRLRTAFGVPQRINTRLNGITNTRQDITHADSDHERESGISSSRANQFSEPSGLTFAGNKPEPERALLSTNLTRATVRSKHLARTVSNSPSYPRQSNDDQFEERPIKSSLSIRKLHLGNVHKLGGFAHATSYGGSFATSSEQALPPARNLRTFNNLSPVRPVAKTLTGLAPTASSHLPPAPKARGPVQNRIFSIEDVQPQPIQPQVPPQSIQPVPQTQNHFYNNSVYRQVGFSNTIATVAPPTPQPLPQPPIATHPIHLNPAYQQQLLEARREHEYLAQQQQKETSLRGLLQCCQDQAPGCRHLCSPEIRRAIQTNECPPLTMTSVLQCFPRFYNISTVGQCCNQAVNGQGSANQQQAVQSVVGFLVGQGAPRLPGQCQSLCAPNFKLSFSHFACVDHINTIVDCYRDLIRR
ncbi:unnamed protein product [Bursaphelenchus xylophilus]|uniref:(pine wood nematode) hypothetical protein n=1 Tax=Bursaphelenchus xylophilus TaxID=6326 RepID=A0A7I8WZY0_BURXY|nr:unnamed protein product [Bursaphelenchus xylophilus]CAG9129579.1 unnamed protein product [Bursaphelenchus xylophilus]